MIVDLKKERIICIAFKKYGNGKGGLSIIYNNWQKQVKFRNLILLVFPRITLCSSWMYNILYKIICNHIENKNLTNHFKIFYKKDNITQL